MTSELESTPRPDDDLRSTSPVAVYAGVGAFVLLIAGFVYVTVQKAPGQDTRTAQTVKQDPAASFTALDGSVKVKPSGVFHWDDATSEAPLYGRDLVRTSVRSSAEITFVDETLVNVRPESLITIKPTDMAVTQRERPAAWLVSSGEVNFKRQRSDGSAEVSTPTLRSEISDLASANVRVDPTGESDFRLFEGKGRVETTAGQTVELESGEAVRVDALGQAGDKLKLPDTPELRAPSDQAQVPEAVPPREPIALQWAAVAGATAYHVMTARDASFTQVELDQTVSGTTATLPRLARGEYHWRVAAVADSAEGAPSTERSFLIVAPPPAPDLEIAALEVRGNIVHVRGSSAAGSRVTINGHDVPTQRDGTFDEFVTLVETGPQTLVVRSVAPNGGVSQRERRVDTR
jgi:hypothetical protein